MLKALKAAAVFTLFALLLTRPLRLFDSDSYLHLALARLLAEQGFVSGLPWTRFSALGAHYGDKELLFHALLVPFARFGDPEQNGPFALALLCTAIALSLAWLARRALGRFGPLAALLVVAGSGSFVLRALRLRPELLSVLVLVWVVWALARERYLLAALLSSVFALSHTAFHSLLGLAIGWFVWQRWAAGRWEWKLLLSVSAGVALGVLVHPSFPDNLHIFWIQNVDFFRLKSQLDIGGEFQPHTTLNLLLLDGVWLSGLAALWLARTSAAVSSTAEPDLASPNVARRMASFSWIAALAFSLLFLQMGRFATLAIPFTTLAFAFEVRARGLAIGPRIAIGGGHDLSTSIALSVIALLALANGLVTSYANWQLAGAMDAAQSGDLRAFAAKLPPDARVAANWDDAEQYAFFAPHARYLNLLDPVFMAVADPARHAAWMRVLRGEDPDPARTLARDLDSGYLAFAAAGREALAERLAYDPRFEPLQRGAHHLYRLRPDADAMFVRDFQPAAPTSSSYVDASDRIAANGCAVLTHRRELDSPSSRLFELAAWGPTVLFVDGEQRLQLVTPGLAKLGHGAALPLRLGPGPHRIVIRTCAHQARAGFYFVDRGPI
ncbi:MAG TPA: hypothetical protein VFN67_17640 [Polyangiales bacterium]|nr:hypothetical protein [Polyangiales bacterium]